MIGIGRRAINPRALVASLVALGGGAPTPEPAPKPVRVPGRSLPKGMQYTGFCGRRAQARYLRQRFRKVEKLHDELSLLAMVALREAVAEDPDPDFALKHLVHVALVMSEDCKTTWAEAVAQMLTDFEKRAEASA